MRISFIGMSNIGKSLWSKRLAALAQCDRYDCDKLIAQHLNADLTNRETHEVSRWMGQPYDPYYGERSQQYLKRETECMTRILDALQKPPRKPVIIDTTGSVIYTNSLILKQLKQATLIVYLEASPDHAAALFRRYVDHPKPVIWGECYSPQADETPRQSIKRCFPLLLAERARLYQNLAHITLPYAAHKDRNADIVALITKAQP